jgi:hypothetical protein
VQGKKDVAPIIASVERAAPGSGPRGSDTCSGSGDGRTARASAVPVPPERGRGARRLWLASWIWLSVLGTFFAMPLYWFPPQEYAVYPRCLLYRLTGLQCPGCGGLRAAHQLLHGHVAASLALNPLVVALALLGGFYGFARAAGRWTGRDWLRPFRKPAWLWFALGVVLVFTILRNCPMGRGVTP